MTKNFSKSEFNCKCGCGFNATPQELADVLQNLRDELGAPITVTSASRCESHNRKVGGSEKSQHLLGTAADIVVSGVSPLEVYSILDSKYPDKYGIGKYNTFTHIDVRSKKARW